MVNALRKSAHKDFHMAALKKYYGYKGRLEGKRALITGAAGGIAQAIAEVIDRSVRNGIDGFQDEAGRLPQPRRSDSTL